MIVGVNFIHNSSIREREKTKKKKTKKDAVPKSMHREDDFPPHPTPPLCPCSSSVPRDLLGENGLGFSEAMRTQRLGRFKRL